MLSPIYSSVATREFGTDDIQQLLTQSRTANAGTSITGMLLFRDGYFLQLLEGPDGAVRGKLETIRRDDRLTRVRVLTEDVVDARQFPDWSMGFPVEDDVKGIPGYRVTFEDLDAHDGGGVGSLPALRELIRWFQPRAGR